MTTIYFPSPLAKKTNISSLDVTAGSLLYCLKQAVQRFPNIEAYIFSDAKLAPFTKIFINQIDSNSIAGLDTTINPDDEIQIVVAISGG